MTRAVLDPMVRRPGPDGDAALDPMVMPALDPR